MAETDRTSGTSPTEPSILREVSPTDAREAFHSLAGMAVTALRLLDGLDNPDHSSEAAQIIVRQMGAVADSMAVELGDVAHVGGPAEWHDCKSLGGRVAHHG